MPTRPTLVLFLTAACHLDSPAAPEPAAAAPPARAATVPFEQELLAAARDYRRFERVSDRANWAPQKCRIPPLAGVQRSASSDADTHGRKLYLLFAKDAATYQELPWLADTAEVREQTASKQVGQVVVKQSWLPVEMPVAEVPKLEPKTLNGHVIPEDHVIDGERAFRTGAQDALFVMLKLGPKTEGTDAGWVYGTLTADGSKVTASGRIASCMECHEPAPHDRLFGMSPPFSKRVRPAKRWQRDQALQQTRDIPSSGPRIACCATAAIHEHKEMPVMLLTVSMLALTFTGPGTASPTTFTSGLPAMATPQEPDKSKQGKDEKGKEEAHGPWLTDHKAALEAAKKAKKPLLMVFTGSDWCPPCKKLHGDVFESAAFKQWAGKNVVLLELDFPRQKELPKELKEQNEKLSKEYRIEGYPTVIVIDAAGKKLYEASGFGGESADDWIKKVEKKIKK